MLNMITFFCESNYFRALKGNFNPTKGEVFKHRGKVYSIEKKFNDKEYAIKRLFQNDLMETDYE